MWEELSAFAERERVPVSNDIFSIYHDMEYKEDVELCAPVGKIGEEKSPFTYRLTKPVPAMACT